MRDTLRGALRSLTVWFNAAAAGLLAVLPELLPVSREKMAASYPEIDAQWARVSQVAYGEEEDEVFLGRSVTQHKNVSDDTARRIDEVVRDFYTLVGHGAWVTAVGASDTHHLDGVVDGDGHGLGHRA